MEFNQLESFLSVVKHKSFSKAAEELYLTQPAISNNIRNLEKELGAILLDRKSKAITLTDSGRKFYKYAVELINTRDQAKYSIAKHLDAMEGVIDIDASSIPEQYVLPYIIKDFMGRYPMISFSINHKNSEEIIDSILIGRQNFGIVGIKRDSKLLEYVDFYEDEIILIVPNNPSFPTPIGTTVDIDFLFSKGFIFRKRGSGTRSLIEQRLEEHRISLEDLKIVSLIDSNAMIKKMVELGLGISLVSSISVKNEIDLGLIKPLRIRGLNLKRNFYFVYSKTRTLSPIVKQFKDFLIHWPGIDNNLYFE